MRCILYYILSHIISFQFIKYENKDIICTKCVADPLSCANLKSIFSISCLQKWQILCPVKDLPTELHDIYLSFPCIAIHRFSLILLGNL